MTQERGLRQHVEELTAVCPSRIRSGQGLPGCPGQGRGGGPGQHLASPSSAVQMGTCPGLTETHDISSQEGPGTALGSPDLDAAQGLQLTHPEAPGYDCNKGSSSACNLRWLLRGRLPCAPVFRPPTASKVLEQPLTTSEAAVARSGLRTVAFVRSLTGLRTNAKCSLAPQDLCTNHTFHQKSSTQFSAYPTDPRSRVHSPFLPPTTM